MPNTFRLAVLSAAAALGLALTGCGADDQGVGTTAPGGAVPTQAPPAQPAPPPATDEQGALPNGAVYGPACDQLPTDGAGSVQDIADDPAGTAVANIPILTRLNQAIEAAGLTETLNDPNATYTVLAPADSAFDALPPEVLDQVLTDPQGQLTDILTYHVIPQRYDAQGLADAGTVETVQGGQLTVSGQPEALVIDEQEQASVLCGNIPTQNATVFVIDTVLMP